MDCLKKRKRNDFIESFIKEIKNEVILARKDTLQYKSWCIHFTAVQLQKYETEVLEKPVLNDVLRERFAEQMIDEYFLNDDLYNHKGIIRFAKYLFCMYDFLSCLHPTMDA